MLRDRRYAWEPAVNGYVGQHYRQSQVRVGKDWQPGPLHPSRVLREGAARMAALASVESPETQRFRLRGVLGFGRANSTLINSRPAPSTHPSAERPGWPP